MEAITRELRLYNTLNGERPFSSWLRSLDAPLRVIVRQRLVRASLGNFGDTKPEGEGVQTLRIHEGPGYRLYYGIDGKEIVLLLCGGDKSSQSKDIRNAKKYWKDYKERKASSTLGEL
ncbi:MAG: type II toxin-antitoxin system RelE/ParE family toxin [Bacteroidota bacterium]|nr:type II toxin-antitoxin system RelE/ParE family toxin [Bacteroidota bacterium]MDP4234089.1 type II toxin-antitoxin system RelE/ParE family toxin [Bacteroidota bacterium]MDP4243030.1 type II toxin-antitoxin system RelE/ParE family toxin [Bacteroidota bacterium]MDP4287456.1 type II toxin-antitoxin system RelE/ParE family toxin [Bacteroidota bacterium]